MLKNFLRVAMLGGAFALLPIVDSAFAEKNESGGGNGNGGNHDVSSDSEHLSNSEVHRANKIEEAELPESETAAEHSKNSGKGKLASKLGALNAAHASAKAFAHASPNSRVGKIKAYYVANVAAEAADANLVTATAANAAAQNALQAVVQGGYTPAATLADAETVLTAAKAALQLGSADPVLLKAVTDAQVVVDSFKASISLALAHTTAVAADDKAKSLLSVAANKTPVDAVTRKALDLLLKNKIVL